MVVQNLIEKTRYTHTCRHTHTSTQENEPTSNKRLFDKKLLKSKYLFNFSIMSSKYIKR